MNFQDKNAETLIDFIRSWSQSNKKLVIGIEGYSGSGKTTLLNQLTALNSDILAVNRDTFAIPRDEFSALFEKATSEAQKVSLLVERTIDVAELADFITKYRLGSDTQDYSLRGEISGNRDAVTTFDFAKPILVIEGIFLFHHKELFDLFDKKVYLDVNREAADNRRRAREKTRWGAKYFPDTHPDSYARLIKIGFTNYFDSERPDCKADLILG